MHPSQLQNNLIFDTVLPHMAPTMPQKSRKRREFDTIKKFRFYNAFDTKSTDASLRQIAKLPEIKVPDSTCRRWFKERESLGKEALRLSRKRSSTLARKLLVAIVDLTLIAN